jgi:hypothetical protein
MKLAPLKSALAVTLELVPKGLVVSDVRYVDEMRVPSEQDRNVNTPPGLSKTMFGWHSNTNVGEGTSDQAVANKNWHRPWSSTTCAQRGPSPLHAGKACHMFGEF